MNATTKASINEALRRIRALASQIPDSSPFAAVKISREMLEYSRQVRYLRATAAARETSVASSKP